MSPIIGSGRIIIKWGNCARQNLVDSTNGQRQGKNSNSRMLKNVLGSELWRVMLPSWVEKLQEPTLETRVPEWLSINKYTLLANLIVVFCITKEIQPILGAYPQRRVEIPSCIKAYEVGVWSRLLQPMQIINTLKRVKVGSEKLMNYCWGYFM